MLSASTSDQIDFGRNGEIAGLLGKILKVEAERKELKKKNIRHGS